jgi:hypothetical protein
MTSTQGKSRHAERTGSKICTTETSLIFIWCSILLWHGLSSFLLAAECHHNFRRRPPAAARHVACRNNTSLHHPVHHHGATTAQTRQDQLPPPTGPSWTQSYTTTTTKSDYPVEWTNGNSNHNHNLNNFNVFYANTSTDPGRSTRSNPTSNGSILVWP